MPYLKRSPKQRPSNILTTTGSRQQASALLTAMTVSQIFPKAQALRISFISASFLRKNTRSRRKCTDSQQKFLLKKGAVTDILSHPF
jgi:hypothetical protein